MATLFDGGIPLIDGDVRRFDFLRKEFKICGILSKTTLISKPNVVGTIKTNGYLPCEESGRYTCITS